MLGIELFERRVLSMIRAGFKEWIGLPAEQREIEVDEGFYVNDLASGATVDIATQHHHYKLVKDHDRHVHLSGHPRFCPEPVDVVIEGSIERGPSLIPNPGYVGLGMRLVFKHPRYDTIITTSPIREIHNLK
jgi:hypothetical protein